MVKLHRIQRLTGGGQSAATMSPKPSRAAKPQARNLKRQIASRFEELLASGEAPGGGSGAAEEDLLLERRLAKKLKLKTGGGVLGGTDGLDALLGLGDSDGEAGGGSGAAPGGGNGSGSDGDDSHSFGAVEGRNGDEVAARGAAGSRAAAAAAAARVEAGVGGAGSRKRKFVLQPRGLPVKGAHAQRGLGAERAPPAALGGSDGEVHTGREQGEGPEEPEGGEVGRRRRKCQLAPVEATLQGARSPDGEGEEPLLEEGVGAPARLDASPPGGGAAPAPTPAPVSPSPAKYVAPHLRGVGAAGGEAADVERLRRRLRGLLNRLSESNVEPIAGETAVIFQANGRSLVGRLVAEEILGALVSGPRGNDLYAAVFAAFVAGTASMVGIDFGASLAAHLAARFEEQYQKGDSLALRNLALLISHLFDAGLLSSALLFELLHVLCDRFQELDVATMVHILLACGMGLRGEDPRGMKDLILAVQARAVHANGAAPAGEAGPAPIPVAAAVPKPAAYSKRVEFMLDTIIDIKNNKKRAAREEPAAHARLKKWLRKLGVENVQLRSVTWRRLLEPGKRGQWWLPGPPGGREGGGTDGGRAPGGLAGEVAGLIDAGAAEADRMLQLAASQRMNTDARRAVFCIVMSGEDYLDAFEKIVSLKLPGTQDREAVRVVVECCMQERTFNPYYPLLAAKLISHDPNHKFTMQYCAWDHFKQLPVMEIRRSANLARFLAQILASSAVSLSILKAVEFSNPKAMTARAVLHFRVLLEALLTEPPAEAVWAVFARIAPPPALAPLRAGLAVFMHRHLAAHAAAVGAAAGGEERAALLIARCQLAKRAMEAGRV